jgi:N-methylhydantoinase A
VLVIKDESVEIEGSRRIYFADRGWVDAAVRRFETVAENESVSGPAILESSFTTVVVDPGATARRTASGSLSITV